MPRWRLVVSHFVHSALFPRIDHIALSINRKLVHSDVHQISPRTQNGGKLPKASLILLHERYLQHNPVPVYRLLCSYLQLLPLRTPWPTKLKILASSHLTADM